MPADSSTSCRISRLSPGRSLNATALASNSSSSAHRGCDCGIIRTAARNQSAAQAGAVSSATAAASTSASAVC
ncbi:hypothetical protein BBK82_35060 [Lentzea guizhouensis]|uniref:Uncharacterized protein n=1 Tax=Lentzea guizhouensis TaxID=1586287 RepID=A0A1B2HRX8_9PSEU|nr:hypothetical protein [Lentzea guizhouensis]ANZ40463.1 hypothetical protein BBK82_35060 [Lentzea guizhouensis]